MSRTGNNRGFTLIEVLLAVSILAVGMIGVIRAYIVLMNSVEVSRFTVEAAYLSKIRMADIEKSAIDGAEDLYGTKSGRFEGDENRLGWEEEVTEIKIKGETPKKESEEGQKEGKEAVFSKVRVSVLSGEGSGPARKVDLYTYLEGGPR